MHAFFSSPKKFRLFRGMGSQIIIFHLFVLLVQTTHALRRTQSRVRWPVQYSCMFVQGKEIMEKVPERVKLPSVTCKKSHEEVTIRLVRVILNCGRGFTAFPQSFTM